MDEDTIIIAAVIIFSTAVYGGAAYWLYSVGKRLVRQQKKTPITWAGVVKTLNTPIGGDEVWVNPHTGARREVPTGFSFTNLFFGFFVPALRGDMKNTVIQILFALVTGGISLVIFPFLYNSQYRNQLAADGFKPVKKGE